MTSPAMPRLVFANQLRGLAALCVLVSHLVGVYWGVPDFVALATASPPQPGPLPWSFRLVSSPWFNFGGFGVALFFLVSGLVIPFSLATHPPGRFLLARALRIYPTYLVAFAAGVAVLHASASYWGRVFPYSPWQVASNALLIQPMLGQPNVDLVNWTLCIELKFYLLMALLAGPIRRGSAATILGLAGAILLAHVLAMLLGMAAPTGPGFWQAASYESMLLVMILTGVLFSFHHAGQLSARGLALGAGAMFAMLCACWKLGSLRGLFPIATVNYGYALLAFAALYALRRRVRAVRILDIFAAISFPLYLLHTLIGFALLKFLMLARGVAYLPALALTFACVVALAALLHIAVERPTIALGRRLSRSRPLAVIAPPRIHVAR